jgi:hypothetical protein
MKVVARIVNLRQRQVVEDPAMESELRHCGAGVDGPERAPSVETPASVEAVLRETTHGYISYDRSCPEPVQGRVRGTRTRAQRALRELWPLPWTA